MQLLMEPIITFFFVQLGLGAQLRRAHLIFQILVPHGFPQPIAATEAKKRRGRIRT